MTVKQHYFLTVFFISISVEKNMDKTVKLLWYACKNLQSASKDKYLWNKICYCFTTVMFMQDSYSCIFWQRKPVLCIHWKSSMKYLKVTICMYYYTLEVYTIIIFCIVYRRINLIEFLAWYIHTYNSISYSTYLFPIMVAATEEANPVAAYGAQRQSFVTKESSGEPGSNMPRYCWWCYSFNAPFFLHCRVG